MALTETQTYNIQATERTASVLSLLGAAFVISTFVSHKTFHKPINRLVFYACFGNVMANIGTIISTSGDTSGSDGPLCQFQGFLIQMFLPADTLWTMAMAVNVYLTFFRKYNQRDLRNLEWKYGIVCYGTPFVPAVVYLFVNTPGKGRIYGSAVMWCWISLKWDFLRVAVFYAPVWVVVFVTFSLHVQIGLRIFKTGRERRKLHEELEGSGHQSATRHPVVAPAITKTTEIAVVYESTSAARKGQSTPLSPLPGADDIRTAAPPTPPAYSFTVEGASRTLTPSPVPQSSRTSFAGSRSGEGRKWSSAMSKAEWSYYKCALLFFITVIVTWVPSSANRVYSLVFPDKVSYGLSLASGLVLPLQGFWNTVIYVATSWPACTALYRRWGERLRGPPVTKRRSGSTSTEASEPRMVGAVEKS